MSSKEQSKKKPQEKKAIHLNTLDPKTLQTLAKQTQAEIENLTQAFAGIKAAQAKFRLSKESVGALAKSGDGSDVLVPLTASLYVPGKVIDSQKILVQLGASYFAEKKPGQAMQYCDRNIQVLKESSSKLQDIIENKRLELEQISIVFQQKVNELNKQQAEMQKA